MDLKQEQVYAKTHVGTAVFAGSKVSSPKSFLSKFSLSQRKIFCMSPGSRSFAHIGAECQKRCVFRFSEIGEYMSDYPGSQSRRLVRPVGKKNRRAIGKCHTSRPNRLSGAMASLLGYFTASANSANVSHLVASTRIRYFYDSRCSISSADSEINVISIAKHRRKEYRSCEK